MLLNDDQASDQSKEVTQVSAVSPTPGKTRVQFLAGEFFICGLVASPRGQARISAANCPPVHESVSLSVSLSLSVCLSVCLSGRLFHKPARWLLPDQAWRMGGPGCFRLARMNADGWAHRVLDGRVAGWADGASLNFVPVRCPDAQPGASKTVRRFALHRAFL
jgi:hypothetical protein